MPANMVNSDFVIANGKPCQVKYRSLAVQGAGDHIIFPATPGVKFRLLAFNVVASAAQTTTTFSGVTQIGGPVDMNANAMNRMQFNPTGHGQTAENQDFIWNLSTAAAMNGFVVYIEVR